MSLNRIETEAEWQNVVSTVKRPAIPPLLNLPSLPASFDAGPVAVGNSGFALAKRLTFERTNIQMLSTPENPRGELPTRWQQLCSGVVGEITKLPGFKEEERERLNSLSDTASRINFLATNGQDNLDIYLWVMLYEANKYALTPEDLIPIYRKAEEAGSRNSDPDPAGNILSITQYMDKIISHAKKGQERETVQITMQNQLINSAALTWITSDFFEEASKGGPLDPSKEQEFAIAIKTLEVSDLPPLAFHNVSSHEILQKSWFSRILVMSRDVDFKLAMWFASTFSNQVQGHITGVSDPGLLTYISSHAELLRNIDPAIAEWYSKWMNIDAQNLYRNGTLASGDVSVVASESGFKGLQGILSKAISNPAIQERILQLCPSFMNNDKIIQPGNHRLTAGRLKALLINLDSLLMCEAAGVGNARTLNELNSLKEEITQSATRIDDVFRMRIVTNLHSFEDLMERLSESHLNSQLSLIAVEGGTGRVVAKEKKPLKEAFTESHKTTPKGLLVLSKMHRWIKKHDGYDTFTAIVVPTEVNFDNEGVRQIPMEIQVEPTIEIATNNWIARRSHRLLSL